MSRPVRPSDLAPLSKLSKLQLLNICIAADSPHASVGCVLAPEVLQSLTALTSLACIGACSSALQHVGSCTALQDLWFSYAHGQRQPAPGPAEWAALGQLTALTQLELSSVHMVAPCDSLKQNICSALAQLAGLEVFLADKWSPELLPLLATCPKLWCLAGGWLPGDVPRTLQLPTVRELEQVHGDVPVCAFPGVTSLQQSGPVTPGVYPQLSRHCKGLVELLLPSNTHSLEHDHEVSQRTAAIRALSGLTSLQKLAVSVCDDAEAAVSAQVVAALTRHSLHSACMYVPKIERPDMSPGSLMHIAQVVGLETFRIDARFLELNHQEVRMLLQACHGISNVGFTVLPANKDVFEEGEAWLQSAKLRQHHLQKLVISTCDPDTLLEFF